MIALNLKLLKRINYKSYGIDYFIGEKYEQTDGEEEL